MRLIDNINSLLGKDLKNTLRPGSKLKVAAASFSIYAYEFHIPKTERERNLTGSEFEIQLKNQLTKKAIARECADWIRRKLSPTTESITP